MINAFHLNNRNQKIVFKKKKIIFHRPHVKLMCFLSSQISTVLSNTWKKHLFSNTGFVFCYWNSTLWLSLGQPSEQHRYCLGVPRPGVTTALNSVAEVTLWEKAERRKYICFLCTARLNILFKSWWWYIMVSNFFFPPCSFTLWGVEKWPPCLSCPCKPLGACVLAAALFRASTQHTEIPDWVLPPSGQGFSETAHLRLTFRVKC